MYGVSCHRSVRADDLLHRDASVSRSFVQKAVCVLSRCPFFGLLQQRISPVTEAYFDQRDFRCKDLLSGFFAQLDAVPFERLSEGELLLGLDHYVLFKGLGHEILAVLKAVLLEAKVVFFSESAEVCSRAVLSLLTLLPGGAWLGFNSEGLDSAHPQFQKYGLPLKCFGPHYGVYPYLGLQMLDILLKFKGFLVGTTNRMLVERAAPDVLIELREDTDAGSEELCRVVFNSKEVRQLVKSPSISRTWLAEELSRLDAAAPTASEDEGDVGGVAAARHSGRGAGALGDSALEGVVPRAAGGGADSRRAASAPARRRGMRNLREEVSWQSAVEASRASFHRHWCRLLARVAVVAGTERDLARGLEVTERGAREELARFCGGSLDFVRQWALQTASGRAWLREHRLPVPERRPPPPRDGVGAYRLANGDEYRGEFRRHLRHGHGLYASAKRCFQYDGQWRRDRRAGCGTLMVTSPQGQQVLHVEDRLPFQCRIDAHLYSRH